MKVFFDTNVLASSIATRGLCSELLVIVLNQHDLLTCEPILQELNRVLADKFHLPASVIRDFLGLLKTEGRIVKSRNKLKLPINDTDDILILACVIAAKADAFITGDNELLDLGAIEGIPILSPRQLWMKLAGLGSGGGSK